MFAYFQSISKKGDRIWRSFTISLILFLFFFALTIIVWQKQIGNQKTLLHQHTEDICYQSSKRLEIFVESHLNVAKIFAKRWATHEAHDFSKIRFQKFGSVILESFRGYNSIQILSPDKREIWVMPQTANTHFNNGNAYLNKILNLLNSNNEISLSKPYISTTGETMFFAALSLQRDKEFLGYLIIDFKVETLIQNCFYEKIRSEFDFELNDGDIVLYSYNFDNNRKKSKDNGITSSISFQIVNRQWLLSMRLKAKNQNLKIILAHISVPLLGFFLSLGISGLFYLLLQRMYLYQTARDLALEEIKKREKTQSDLRDSESRYKDIFNSASEGFLILDHNGVIVEANPSLCSMYEYNISELKGKSFKMLISPDHQLLFDLFIHQLELDGKAILDFSNIRKDGSFLDVEVRGSFFQYGSKQRVLVTLTDVTERKRAEQQRSLLSKKVMIAQEQERTRISRELHDELGQLLTALHIELDWLNKKVQKISDDYSILFQNSISLVEKSAGELRRICRGLRPPLLDDLGLEPAIRLLVSEFEDQTNIETNLNIYIPENLQPLNDEISLCLYRILQESLTNIRRHSKAKSSSISLFYRNDEMTMIIYDNGIGFDMSESESYKGSGIAGMYERTSLVNGSLEIKSASSEGTRITLKVPIFISKIRGE